VGGGGCVSIPPRRQRELDCPGRICVDEIAMAVVDHHEIALRIEPRPPQFIYAARARSKVRKRPLPLAYDRRNGSK